MLVVGAPLAVYGLISMGALIACIIISWRLIPPIHNILSLWLRHQDFIIAKEKLDEFKKIKQIEKVNHSSHYDGTVVLNDVGYSILNNGQFIIKNLNLVCSPGKAVYVTGLNELESTLLVRLLLGTYIPQQGDVVIDGIHVHQYDSEELVKHIAYLSFEECIINGTIRENIARFNSSCDKSISNLCHLLHLDEEIEILDQGYNTKIGGKNEELLTINMRQRINIARALLNKPKIIIYYYAEKSFDIKSYHAVYTILAKLKPNTTMIIFSNDNNIISLADLKLDLSEGKISVNPRFQNKNFLIESVR